MSELRVFLDKHKTNNNSNTVDTSTFKDEDYTELSEIISGGDGELSAEDFESAKTLLSQFDISSSELLEQLKANGVDVSDINDPDELFSSLNNPLLAQYMRDNPDEISGAEFKYNFVDSLVDQLGFDDSIVIGEKDLEKLFAEIAGDDGVLTEDELAEYNSKDAMQKLFKEQDISLEGQFGNFNDELTGPGLDTGGGNAGQNGVNGSGGGGGSHGGGGGNVGDSNKDTITETPSEYDGAGSTPEEQANDLRTNVIPGLQGQAGEIEGKLNAKLTEEVLNEFANQELAQDYRNNETAITETEALIAKEDKIIVDQGRIIDQEVTRIAGLKSTIANIENMDTSQMQGSPQTALSTLRGELAAAEARKAAAKIKKDQAQMLKNTAELKLHLELEPEKDAILAEIVATENISDEIKTAIETYRTDIVDVNAGMMTANQNLDLHEEEIEENQDFPEENKVDKDGNLIDINGNIIEEDDEDAIPAAADPEISEEEISDIADDIEAYFDEGREDFIGIPNLSSYFGDKEYTEADLYAVQLELQRRILERTQPTAEEAQEEPTTETT